MSSETPSPPSQVLAAWLSRFSNEAAAILDAEGHILTATPKFSTELSGVSGLGTSSISLLHWIPENSEDVRAALTAVTSGASLARTVRIGRGSRRELRLSAIPNATLSAQALALATLGALSLEPMPPEAWMPDFLGRLPYGFLIADERLMILGSNRQFGHLFDVDDAKLAGATLSKFIDPAQSDLYEAAGDVLRGKVSAREFSWVVREEGDDQASADPRGGTVFGIDSPSVDGRLLGFAFRRAPMRQDRVAQVLKSLQERFRSAFEHSPFGMALVGLDGRFLQVNEQLAKILGHSPADLLTLTSLELAHPETRESVCEADALVLSGEIRKYVHERRCVDANGGDRWVLWSVALPASEDQRPLYTIAQVVDLTRERQEREEKVLLERQLRQAQKLEAVGLLAGGIAHDFNNVLQIISSNTEILQEDLAELEVSADLMQSLKDIDGCVQRGRSMGQKLLAFGRQTDLNLEQVPIARVLVELEELLGALVRDRVELEVQTQPKLGQVNIDVRQFEQILINLVLNARDALPEGGSIIIAATLVELDSRDLPPNHKKGPGSYVDVTVCDNGSGIEREAIDHIFEPFFTTKPEGKGTGLGLAAVHGIINQCDGHVTVESTLGEGTTFHLLLPHHAATSERPARRARPRVLRSGNELILLCEDNKMIRDRAEQMLQRAGYKVLVAGSGEEALRVAAGSQQVPDLLLTDVVMPGMTGPGLASVFSDRYSSTRVIFMTGYATQGQLAEDSNPSGHRIVQKPFYQAELLEAVRDVLDSADSEGSRPVPRVQNTQTQRREQAGGEGA